MLEVFVGEEIIQRDQVDNSTSFFNPHRGKTDNSNQNRKHRHGSGHGLRVWHRLAWCIHDAHNPFFNRKTHSKGDCWLKQNKGVCFV